MASMKVHLLPDSRRDWIAIVVLFAIAFGVFAPALRFPFVTFDDPYYVFQNANVLSGLNTNSIYWAWTTFDQSNWHPLTWMSLQLDVSLWGPNAAGFHFTNVFLHAANAVLVFVVLRALTGSFWQSAAVSLLFAIHPLRVESVAWVTERKDVLSIFFGLLALWGRAAYVAAPSLPRYVLVAGALALSLLAKPMMVTLPCLFLVLDWWPLGRIGRPRDWVWPILEELPLAALVVGSAILTYLAQSGRGAVQDLETLSLPLRVENAVVAYVRYLTMTVWPFDLAVYYPHPGANLSVWKIVAATGVLATITLAGVLLRRRSPYLLAGWLWYLGTLVPVIGLVQVGSQAIADRYTYFPQIGVLIVICWGVAELAGSYSREAILAVVAAAIALGVVTHRQLLLWRDSIDLWQHTLAVAGESATARISLGRAQEDRGQIESALHNYELALQVEPDSLLGLTCIGALLSKLDRPDEALPYLLRARDLEPRSAMTHSYLGAVYFQQKKADAALEEEKEALARDPSFAPAYCAIGQIESSRGNVEVAVENLEEALRITPNLAEAHLALAEIQVKRGEKDSAVAHLTAAVQFKPGFGPALVLLSKTLSGMGKDALLKGDLPRALGYLGLATKYDPQNGEAFLESGKALEARRDFDAAAGYFERAAQLNPKSAESLFYFGIALARHGQSGPAQKYLEEAVDLDPANAKFQSGLAQVLDAVAAGEAAEGNPSRATITARRARSLAAAAGNEDLVRQIESQLKLYEQGESGKQPSNARP
jgi:tetratricopeptide (TPR) repeat protein